MPRSFLLKQYFRRKYYWLIDDAYDEDEESEADSVISNFAYGSREIGQFSNATTFPAVDNYNWNYEDEKSYWFELNGQVDEERLNGGARHDFHKEEREQSNSASKQLPPKSDSSSELHTSDNLSQENLDAKLNQMLQENPEIVKRNIKQFLENNRIFLTEIAVEIGIKEEIIKSYINGNESFTKEQREEFYKWYLMKILRPPSGLDEKSYTCYKCGKIFAYESYLERHIKYVCPDNTGRTWKCSYCGKAFQYPCYLKRHIRSHTGESPYKCDQCDRAFVRSTDLQRHIRNHTGEKPYKCSECERAFARSTDLKRHMRTHTGEKPYKCWQCGKTFSQSGSLQTHLHTHNKENSSGRKLAKGSK